MEEILKTEILTAMDNSEFNQILKERLENMKVYEDVSYFEGIKENIIKNPNISIIIINEMIGTKEELIKIIQELKSSKYKIEIIIFLEKEEEEMRFIICSILFFILITTFSLVRLSGQISQKEYQHNYLK